MQAVLSIAVSLGSLCVISFVLISCASCRRFIAKRKLKGKEKKEKKHDFPETKIDLQDVEKKEKEGNGIANPSYQEPDLNKKESEEDPSSARMSECSTIDETADELNGNVEQKRNSKSSIGSGVVNGCFEDIQEEDEQSIDGAVFCKSPDRTIQTDSPVQDLNGNKSLQDKQEVAKVDEDEVFLHKEECKTPTQQDAPLYKPCHSLTEEELEAYNDVVFQGEWRRPVALKHLVETGLIDKATADEAMVEAEDARIKMQMGGYYDEEKIPHKLKKYLCGEEPVAGIIMTASGEKKSIFKSAKEGILRRGTAISLLEAQAATGNIIDPVSGRKVSVKEATGLGLLDRVYETVLLRAERAVSGYKFRASDHVLSLYEAMQKGLVVESHGLRLLEAQHATGGVIDHRINVRVPLDVAVERGLLDERLKQKLENDEGDETKTFFDPNTGQNVTYQELMQRSVLDEDTGLRLYPLEKVLRKRLSYGSSFSGRLSVTSSRANSHENIPSALASP